MGPLALSRSSGAATAHGGFAYVFVAAVLPDSY